MNAAGDPPDVRGAPDLRGAEGWGVVRPYAMVAGRTRIPEGIDLSLEALIRGVLPDPSTSTVSAEHLTTEERRILHLTATTYQSVAELSARLRVPVGVVRIVVADLLDRGRVQVGRRPAQGEAGLGLDILESVLDGISSI